MPNHCYNRVDIGINSDSEDAKQQFSKFFQSLSPVTHLIGLFPNRTGDYYKTPNVVNFLKLKK